MQLERVDVEIKLSSAVVETIREITGAEIKTFRMETIDDESLTLPPSRLENIKVL